MIYVPEFQQTQCAYVYDSNTIRVYDYAPYQPSYNQNYNLHYIDYFVNSNYIYKEGSQQFSNYNYNAITCIPSDKITTNFYYRNDFDKICVIFFIFLFINYFIMKKIIRVFFHGRRFA